MKYLINWALTTLGFIIGAAVSVWLFNMDFNSHVVLGLSLGYGFRVLQNFESNMQ